MERNQKILNFIEELQSAYLEKRDFNKVLEYFDSHITFIGTGKNDIVKGIDEAKVELDKELHIAPRGMKIENYHYDISEITNSFSFVNGYVIASFVDEGELYQKVYFRISAILIKKEERYYFYHIHLSVPSTDQLDTQIFPKILKESVSERFEDLLQQKNEEVQVIANSVPGGVLKCRNDEDWTILEINEGFLNLFGYNKSEIQSQFQNSFKAMIDINDQDKAYKSAQTQMKYGDTKIIEYRVTCKDGHNIWILDKGQRINDSIDGSCFICILIDITNEKDTQEELNLALERYRIIMDQTNDIIFEWDIIKNELTISDNWQKSFFSLPSQNKLPSNIDDFNDRFYNRFHKQSRLKIAEMIKKIKDGVDYQENEIRLAGKNQHYVWYKIRVTTQYNESQEPIKAVGVLINVDREKRESQRLMRKAEMDTLTGIYNKMSAHQTIEASLKEEQNGLLMILDLDYFKQINDYHGHLFGDSVLIQISECMKNNFADAILGRIGGDEFIIYLPGLQDLEEFKQHAQRLLDDIKKINEKMNQNFMLSASLGIAQAPLDGRVLQELYQKADHALYEAKNLGKDRYIFYDEEHLGKDGIAFLNQMPSVINERIDSDEETVAPQTSIIEYIFRILYRSKDLYRAIQNIMDIIGTHFDVSRVYIFENDLNNEYCNNTFEWCNTDVVPQIGQLQHISYEQELEGYENNFDQNGMFYCPDINCLPKEQYELLAPQGIKSMLQCGIYDDGMFRGYVGFDECRNKRYWTQEQINILTLLSEILSVFLLKSRAKDNAENETSNLMNVLNHQSTALYVVDKENKQLLFANKKTLDLAAGVRLGVPCYKAFLDKEEPCEVCPIKTMDLKEGRTLEIYNPYLDLWVLSDASVIQWQGNEAYLISNQNITAYKKK